jgi:hypothetical protein
MKSQNRISPLTLELYHRGLTTRKENKLVEKALETDNEVRKRYEALTESDREIRRLVTKELSRFNIPETRPAPAPRKKRLVIILAAAMIVCAFIPAIFYLKNSGSNVSEAIIAGTGTESETTEGNLMEDNKKIEEIAITEDETGNNPKDKTDKPVKSGGVSIAVAPETDNGIRIRGVNEPQQAEVTDITIPPGLTFIFENMFANKQLSAVVIPDRVTSIAKNAFADNPLVSVTIGENVVVDDEAIPGNFAKAYNSYGKAAGTYIRPDTNSGAWEKK